GAPGCGKTTTIHCLISSILGDKAKNATLELNASNERGIDVIRERIKRFAQQKINLPDHAHHKYVILDEADSMTEGTKYH
ncbi:MAG: Subunit of heteropentameric Replication factor C (RF-C), partial [Paramarteilia canceri]